MSDRSVRDVVRTLRTRRSVMACLVLAGTLGAIVAHAPDSALAIEIIREVEPGAQDKVRRLGNRLPNNFLEQWVFNGGATFATAHKRLDSLLQARLASIGHVCAITDAQSTALKLAGAGDIHQFMREYERLQRTIDPADQNQINNLWQEVQPLREKFNSSLFGRDSLFERTLHACLRPDQCEHLEKRQAASRQFQLETAIRQVVVGLDDIAVLSEEERDTLTQLLVKEVPPPDALETPNQKQMLLQYVLWRCRAITRKDLLAFLGDDATDALQKATESARGYEQHFRMIGMIKGGTR